MATTFIEQCLAGDIDPEAIDDFVDAWHDGAGPGVTLEDFLGMDATEYALWVERPGMLPSILAAHRSGLPLASAIFDSEKMAPAASAINPDDAREILVWLKKTRRL